MAKTDWRFTDTVIPEDLNGIGEEINGLRTEMSTRFDHEATTPLTLQSGLQVVHANKDARFKLGEIRGRTLVNLLGSKANCEDIAQWGVSQGSTELSKENYVQGTNSIKLEIAEGYSIANIFTQVPVEVGKRYLFVGELKSSEGAEGRIGIFDKAGRNVLAFSSLSANSKKFTLFYTKSIALEDSFTLSAEVHGASGSTIFIDGLRIYEIPNTEYDELDNMTSTQLAQKYPFISPGIKGVENPYLINTSGNLLPPFYEWTGRYSFQVEKPYTASSRSIKGQVIYVDIPVVCGISYTLSFESLKCIYIAVHDNSGPLPIDEMYLVKVERDPTDDSKCNYQFVGPSTGTVRVHIYGYDLQAEIDGVDRQTLPAYELRAIGPTLTTGAAVSSFKNQHKSMLAFQTELFADPSDGSNPDIIFEQNKEYHKLARWNTFTFNALDNKVHFESPVKYNGFTRIRLANIPGVPIIPAVSYLTDCSGMRVPNAVNWSVDGPLRECFAQSYDTPHGNYILVNIPISKSGWDDSYTPTEDEIKAYFLGWKMYPEGGVGRYAPYNGVGTKYWYPLSRVGDPFNVSYRVSGMAPTTQADNKRGYLLYKLLYLLAKEHVEPVVAEGSLLLSEGKNMLRVDTGILIRERNLPVISSTAAGINIISSINSALKHKADQILTIYKNGEVDYAWDVVIRTDGTAYGKRRAFTDINNYDQSAAYSVTYTKLDKSPIQPITGSLATNEKAQISDLTAGVTEALQRVSVVEQKKAEKDAPLKAPEWITPTLLNTFTAYGGAFTPPRYYKDPNGIVHLQGLIRAGSVSTVGTPMFNLAAGYRPKLQNLYATIGSSDTPSVRVDVTSVGNVSLQTAVTSGEYISLAGISFLAEQ